MNRVGPNPVPKPRYFTERADYPSGPRMNTRYRHSDEMANRTNSPYGLRMGVRDRHSDEMVYNNVAFDARAQNRNPSGSESNWVIQDRSEPASSGSRIRPIGPQPTRESRIYGNADILRTQPQRFSNRNDSISHNSSDATSIDEPVASSYINFAFDAQGEDIPRLDPRASNIYSLPVPNSLYEPAPTYDLSSGDEDAPSTPDEPHETSRHYSEDELMYRLKLAHLSPGTEWFGEISAVSKGSGDQDVYAHVLDSLRDFPLAMADKLRLSQKLRAQIDGDYQRSHSASQEALRWRHNTVKKLALLASRTVSMFELWAGSIARISGRFGTNVASYFQFLRFLTQLNLLLGLIMFAFILAPQVISGELLDDGVKTGFFAIMSRSIIFYGAYSDANLIQHETTGITWTYERPLAYLMTWVVVSLLALGIIVSSMFVSYRQIKRSGDDKREDVYTYQSLVSWDYSLASKKGSKLRSQTISTAFKEMVRDEKTKKKQEEYSRLQLILVRIGCNILSLAVLGVSAYLIVLVAQSPDLKNSDVPQHFLNFIDEYKLPILVSVMKVVVPRVLSLLLKLERYHPRTEIKLEITRTASFYVASLVVFLASIYSIATECMGTSRNSTEILNTTETSNLETDDGQPTYCCWENQVGEQLLQLVILDLLINVGVSLAANGGQALLVKLVDAQKLGYPDFQVGRLILDLVYGQCLVWLGLYFIPGLALLAAVKLVITFYFNQVVALTCCVPPTKVFRASRSGSFYLFVLAASLFACLMPMVIGVLELQPSTTCGPFRQSSRSYFVVLDKIGELPYWIQDTLHFISTPGFVIPIVFALLFLVLYYRAKSTTHALEAEDLRHHLQFERKVEKRRVIARVKQERRLSGAVL